MWKHILMGVVTLISVWLATAGIRFVASQSYWVLAIDAPVWGLWWLSLYLFKDWGDYRRLAPTMIIASMMGTALGLTIPAVG